MDDFRKPHKPSENKPSEKRLSRAAAWTVVLIAAIIAIFFVGRNIWHYDELKEDQIEGSNRATSFEENPD